MRLSWFTIVVLTPFLSAFGQLPELNEGTSKIEGDIQEVLNLAGGNVEANQLAFNLSLARDYYALDAYAKAEYHYLRVIDQDICTPLDYKALGISLRHNGKAILGSDFYKAYNEVYGKSTNDDLFFKSIDTKLGDYKRVRQTAVTNYNWIYGSVNPDGSTNLNIDNGTVTANLGCKAFINRTGIELPDVEFGKVGSFCPGPEAGSYVYSYKENDHYHIYLVRQKKGQFTKAVKLDLGPEDSDYAYPYYSGTTLYFASNKEGGLGGYDLYSAAWTGKGFTDAQTMGNIINSDKNEILPNVLDGQFMFSSNGHPGQGGYDMYYADWAFTRLTPVPYPFNSADNEFQLLDLSQTDASVIKALNGRTNVYYVEIYEDYNRVIQGQVVDEAGSPIPDAYVILNDVVSKNFDQSDATGRFDLSVIDTIENYHVTTLCDGYITDQLSLSLSTLGNNTLIIQLSKPEPPKPQLVSVKSIDATNVIPTAPSDSLQPDTTALEALYTYSYVVFQSTTVYKEVYDAWIQVKDVYDDVEIIRHMHNGTYYVVRRIEGDVQSLHEQLKTYKVEHPNAVLLRAAFF